MFYSVCQGSIHLHHPLEGGLHFPLVQCPVTAGLRRETWNTGCTWICECSCNSKATGYTCWTILKGLKDLGDNLHDGRFQSSTTGTLDVSPSQGQRGSRILSTHSKGIRPVPLLLQELWEENQASGIGRPPIPPHHRRESVYDHQHYCVPLSTLGGASQSPPLYVTTASALSVRH